MRTPKRTAIAVTNTLVALMLLLGAGAARAQDVKFDDLNAPFKATRILGLDVPGFGAFDVEFKAQKFANEIYGEFPGDLVQLAPFFNPDDTALAANAVNAALNDADATSIGEVGGEEWDGYAIGWVTFICCELPLLPDPVIDAIVVIRSVIEGVDWLNLGENLLSYNADEREWAVFTPVPEPGTTLSLVAGLATIAVLRRRRS